MDFFFFAATYQKNYWLSNNKKFTPLFYRIQQRIHEKKNLKRSFGLRSWLSQSLRGGVGVWVIIKSNSCNSQWNSALAILIVRVNNDLNEREQIDLRLVCFFNEPLLLFCFLKLVLTFNYVRGSLECDYCKFSETQR